MSSATAVPKMKVGPRPMFVAAKTSGMAAGANGASNARQRNARIKLVVQETIKAALNSKVLAWPRLWTTSDQLMPRHSRHRIAAVSSTRIIVLRCLRKLSLVQPTHLVMKLRPNFTCV